jgi:hypothetical protein
VLGLECLQRIEPIAAGHANIEQDQLRLQFAGAFNRFMPRSRFANDFELVSSNMLFTPPRQIAWSSTRSTRMVLSLIGFPYCRVYRLPCWGYSCSGFTFVV